MPAHFSKIESMSKKKRFLHQHALSIASAAILLAWIGLYSVSDPRTHLGSFFGNAIADWSGVVVMVLATKHLYEQGSAESRRLPKSMPLRPALEFLRCHWLPACAGSVYTSMWIRNPNGGKWSGISCPSGRKSSVSFC
jgi:hypothetical protein